MQKKLIVRFQPRGRKHKAFYRVVVAQKYRSASKLANEVLGWYNPYTKECSLNQERVKHYLDLNIEISPSVLSLLKRQSIIK